MHALHIASGDLWAGAEVQISTLLTQLVKKGEKVSAIVLNEGRLAKELAANGVFVTILPESEYGLIALISKIKEILKSTKPDVIHTHRQKEHIVGSIANLLCNQVACVRTVHGSPEFSLSFKQRVQTSVDRFCGRFLQHAVISVDAELTEKLARYFKRGKIHTIPNGIDAEQTIRLAKNVTDTVNKSFTHIGIVGRLEPVKRVDLFIRMASEILRSQHNEKEFHFHIFGDGKLAVELKQLATELSIEKHITFHGHTNLIQGWMGQMDVIVMPSDHEGLPMTALECLALGKPLVAHAVGGLIPLLSKAFPIGLVEDHSAAGYADKILETLDKRQNISLPHSYHASVNADRVLSLYQSL
ncbi:glycosyltransferase [Alteromonas ponticola]|uniref:Glycosyltransferase n=1 Tax=Alteromonas ponticola TaxID=2720613 RepID=A0ABX1QYY8_9ALTE|nr:glycosyltransferase [Alteromonas ponticola]NMH59064.1 glycosyltransferase [Alteromonas ponticola]